MQFPWLPFGWDKGGPWALATRVALVGLAIVAAWTFRDYGMSWDEEYQSQYGQAVLDYYVSGFQDHRYREIFNLYLYGGMFDGLANALAAGWPQVDLYTFRHGLNALCGLLGLWGVWRLGRLAGGPATGFTALALLALTPMYLGHMFNNPKDIPFAAGVTWTLYYMGRNLRAFPDIPPRLILKLGALLGLTLGVRVGGVLLLVAWGAALVVRVMPLLAQSAPPLRWTRAEHLLKAFLRLVVPTTVIAYVVMLACWPWAQESPLIHPWQALWQFSHFPQDVEVLLNGVTLHSTNLPWFYAPLYLGVQLPLPQLVLMTLGLGAGPWFLARATSAAERGLATLLVVTALTPVLVAVLAHSALYDAVRHFLFILPPLAVLGALTLTKTLARLPRAAVALVLAAVLGGLLEPIAAMVRLHPYEYIYANPLIGGVRGAFGRFDLDYWGSSFREAAEELQRYVAREGGVPEGHITQVAICGPWSAALIYLPPDYEAVEATDPDADFFLSTTRWMCSSLRPGREIVRITRDGVPLSVIKDLRVP